MNPSERNKTLVSFLTKHGAKKIAYLDQLQEERIGLIAILMFW